MSLTSEHTCSNCGDVRQQWSGKCQVCKEWGTISQTTKKRTTGAFNTVRKPTGEKALFDQIWAARKHVSYISNVSLEDFKEPDPRYVSMFAHVLAKSQYPKQRLNEECIVLLTPGEHVLYDHGTSDQRKRYVIEMAEVGISVDWSRLHILKEKLKEKYG